MTSVLYLCRFPQLQAPCSFLLRYLSNAYDRVTSSFSEEYFQMVFSERIATRSEAPAKRRGRASPTHPDYSKSLKRWSTRQAIDMITNPRPDNISMVCRKLTPLILNMLPSTITVIETPAIESNPMRERPRFFTFSSRPQPRHATVLFMQNISLRRSLFPQ